MKNLVLSMACAAAFCALDVRADEENAAEAKDAEKSEEAAEGGDTAEEVAEVNEATKRAAKFFTALPCCAELAGRAEVLRPGAEAWIAAEDGHHYPLGSSYRTLGAESRMTVRFGKECKVTLGGSSSVGTRAQAPDVKDRHIRLIGGDVTVSLPRNLPLGLFSVEAPGFSVVNPAGESHYDYALGVKDTGGDGDDAVVRCVTGTLAVKGRHFDIPLMRAANAVRIRTSQDHLFTGLYGTGGDVNVTLDQGLEKAKDYDTGIEKVTAKTLVWKLSPQTAVRIHRAVPEIGEKMAVTVMTFDTTGGLRNRCAFTEGRYEMSTGELASAAIKEKEELAKKAAAEAESASQDKSDEKAEEKSEEKSEEKASEE